MDELTIRDMQSKLKSGELTSRELTEGYLDRIKKIDRKGLAVNSVIEVNPDALEIAEALDQERKARKVRGPLHGVPILVKDNIETADRMQTTAGSLALEGHHAAEDAFVIARLRAAGAVILGKTNLSEWANFRGRRSVSGWSSRGGLTRNPYALDRSAIGSSSGSGAAPAANLCAAAVGTETDGSIISPATANGIVGIKPTVGLLSRSGIIPISHSQDTPGPMARTVADAAILLGAMVGVDAGDAATKKSGKKGLTDYTPFLDAKGLKGARIGVARNMAGTGTRVLEIFEQSIAAMKNAGATIVDPANVPNFNKFGKTELEVMYFEYKAGLDCFLSGLEPGARVHNLEELIAFNEAHKDKVMPYFGQEHLEKALTMGPLTSPKYKAALEKNHRLTRNEGLDAVIKKHRLDALIVPSGAPAWMIDLVLGDAFSGWDMESTSVAAVAGYPNITVPAGYIYGMPVGISFIGRAWQEPTLIKLAYAFEQATQARVPPRFLKTAELK